MPEGVTGFFGYIPSPVDTIRRQTGLQDDFKWREGQPPPLGSPLLPFSYIPWYKMKWVGDNIIPPKLSYQGIKNISEKIKTYTLPTVNNHPTHIKDYHILSVRDLIEQLYSPKIDAHIHLNLDGEIFVKPLFAINHGSYRPADYYEFWESTISPTNPEEPYVFSVAGFYSGSNGHNHYWNAGATGFNKWKATLKNDHGGSIGEEVGNYEIINIEYSYILKKYYRRVFSQDGMNIWNLDYNSYVRRLHLHWYDSFEPDFLIGFAVDSGDYFCTDSNTDPTFNNLGRVPKTFNIAGQEVLANVILSSCTLPIRENVHHPWFEETMATHDQVRGYEIVLDHETMLANSSNRFCQLSVYSPDLGDSIAILNPISYFDETIQSEWKVGDEFEVNINSEDKIESEPGSAEGSRWVTSLIGTRLDPKFRLTLKDINDNQFTVFIYRSELYSGKNIDIPGLIVKQDQEP